MNTAETDGKAIEGRKRLKISPYEELNNWARYTYWNTTTIFLD